MKTKEYQFRLIPTVIFSGFVMRVVGGLYHNLISPTIVYQVHPHFEGLGITLIFYIIICFLMTYFYQNFLQDKGLIAKFHALIGLTNQEYLKSQHFHIHNHVNNQEITFHIKVDNKMDELSAH